MPGAPSNGADDAAVDDELSAMDRGGTARAHSRRLDAAACAAVPLSFEPTQFFRGLLSIHRGRARLRHRTALAALSVHVRARAARSYAAGNLDDATIVGASVPARQAMLA